MGFGKTEFPRKSCVFNTRPARSASPSIVSGDENMICLCFRNTACDNAHANFGNQLHRHAAAWIGTFQVVDELFEILNGVDVVVRWWGDEANASSGVTRAGNRGRYFVAGEFTTFAWFRALRHFDL
jgi:hypothetical protein